MIYVYRSCYIGQNLLGHIVVNPVMKRSAFLVSVKWVSPDKLAQFEMT